MNADGIIPTRSRRNAWGASHVACRGPGNTGPQVMAVRCVADEAIRDVPELYREDHIPIADDLKFYLAYYRFPPDKEILAWNDGTVIKLARKAYDAFTVTRCTFCGGSGVLTRENVKYPTSIRHISCPQCYGRGYLELGHLDNERLAILADALEDAGCVDARMLDHLRSGNHHWRGCAVLDSILGYR